MSPVPIPATAPFTCVVSFQSVADKDRIHRLESTFHRVAMKQPGWTAIDLFKEHRTFTWRIQSTNEIAESVINQINMLFDAPDIHSFKVTL